MKSDKKKSGNKIIHYLTDPDYRFLVTEGKCGHFRWMSDEKFLKKKFKAKTGYCLDLNNPQTFNEKLQWLKLHDRNPVYTSMVDKYEVKKIVSEKIGEEFIIPTIGVWSNPNEIDFSALPNQFVLKCTHDSHSVIICKDKSSLDIKRTKSNLSDALKSNYYYSSREWPYKDVKSRIIAEPFLTDESGVELKDYKLMCFNGQVRCSFVCSERFTSNDLKVTFFDRDWNRLPFIRLHPASAVEIQQPLNYKKMIEFAEILSNEYPFVRVDFYESSKKLYFGEMTFYPGSGFEPFDPPEWDKKLGDWIQLPAV